MSICPYAISSSGVGVGAVVSEAREAARWKYEDDLFMIEVKRLSLERPRGMSTKFLSSCSSSSDKVGTSLLELKEERALGTRIKKSKSECSRVKCEEWLVGWSTGQRDPTTNNQQPNT